MYMSGSHDHQYSVSSIGALAELLPRTRMTANTRVRLIKHSTMIDDTDGFAERLQDVESQRVCDTVGEVASISGIETVSCTGRRMCNAPLGFEDHP